MTARRHLIAVLSLAGVVALAGYAYYANRSPATPQPAAAASAAGQGGASRPGAPAAGAAPVGVETVAVVAETVADDVTAVGTLRSNESVVLRPEVAGRIAAIRFREGARSSAARSSSNGRGVQQRKCSRRRELALHRNFAARRLFNRKFLSERARRSGVTTRSGRANMALAKRVRAHRLRAPFAASSAPQRQRRRLRHEGDDLVNLEDLAT